MAPSVESLEGPRASVHDLKGQTFNVSTNEIVDDTTVISRETTNERPVAELTVCQAQQPIVIKKTVVVARETRKRIIHDLRDVNEDDFKLVNLQYYLDFISDERLIHMPARGSNWDRVLTAAEYFGVQMREFTRNVSHFIQDHEVICDTTLASCYLLLQLGCEQAEALEPTFNALYALGALLSRTLQLKDHFLFSPAIAEDVGHLLEGLVKLVGEIAVLYRRQILAISGPGSKSDASVTIDFEAAFGSRITELWTHREHLINHMWRNELGDHKKRSLDIADLRSKLSPTKESVKAAVYGRVAERKERVEGTCEWIQRDLSDFLEGKQQIFTITGNAGCGKSMLASWVRERLEKRINLTKFETLSYTFSEDNGPAAKTVSFLKSILAQLLEHSVGDVQLFDNLTSLFTKEKGVLHDAKKLESRLWQALDVALATRAKDKTRYPRLIIVIDGLDEAEGGQTTAHDLHKKIFDLVDKHIRIRAITFSRPVSHVGQHGGRHLTIGPEHLRDDIGWYLEDRFARSSVCRDLPDEKFGALVSSIAQRAKGSFLFAYLAVQYLKTGVALDVFQKTILGLKEGDATEVLKKLQGKIDLEDRNVKDLFIFTLTAERPLTRGEMIDLLSVNLTQKRLSDSVDLNKWIKATRGLIVQRRGLIRFKSSVIRSHFLKSVCGTALMSLQDAQAYMTMSLLLFARCVLKSKHEPSCDREDDSALNSALNAHYITEYIIHNWARHFELSSLIQSDKLHISQAFKDIFPESSLFASLEWACWDGVYGMSRALALHNLTLRIRTACFGEKHRSVLQTLVILGSLHRHHHSDVTVAAEFFYRAMSIGRTVLYQFNPFVVSCANTFLVLSETITITERTTIVTYREETIRFVIEVCKVQYGGHSDAVIQWLEVLAKLYIQIRETHHATVIYKEIREILIIKFGRDSPQVKRIINEIVGMAVVLKKDVVDEEIEQMDDTFFDVVREVDSESEDYFKIMFQRIEYFEVRFHFVFAEKLYLTLWRHVCELYRRKTTLEVQLWKINVAVKYIRFLQHLKRHEEATNIMICIWAEYEHHSCDSETIIIRLKELAVLARGCGMLTISIAILNKVWIWFKERKLTGHKEAESVTVIVTEVVEEITETIVETKTTTIVTETLTREVWETTYTRCKGGHVDPHFYKACVALISLYLKLEKWSEAETVTRRSLEIIWKAVLVVDAKLTLEGKFIKERVIIATRLAICLHRQRHFEKAEEIYLRIFRACLISCHAEDACLMDATLTLINFYEEFHRHEKAIAIYVEVLAHYRKHLGAKHTLTMTILRKLASVYMLLGRKEAYECYIEILSFYLHDGHCHAEGLDTAIIVIDFYYREKRWTELQKLCGVLWATFTHRHHEITFSEEYVQIIYERYRYVLEFHAKVEFTILYKLTIEYRETVTKVFGVSTALFIACLIALAELCEKSEPHQHESVTVYEEIITRSKTITTITETKVTTIKKRLSKLYVTIIRSGKSTTTTTIDRAIEICLEVYEKLKVEMGCWHEATLVCLMELCILYKTRGTKESGGIIIRLLRESIVEIITKVTVSLTLYTAAKTLASIYIACDMVKYGHELLQQLHILLLFPDVDVCTTGFDKGGSIIKLNTRVTKVSFVFLIVLEQCLHGHTLEFSELMADILLESLLYEQYVTVMTSFSDSTQIELVLERAARLRCAWVSRHRENFVKALDNKLFPLFRARYSHQLGQSADADAVFDFYVALLTEIGGGANADQLHIEFDIVTCKASLGSVRRLMLREKPDLRRAQAVAKVAYGFVNMQGYYRKKHCIKYGYRLAELLAGVDVPAWKKADESLKESLRNTSRDVLDVVLRAMKDSHIELVSLRFDDLVSLIRLLGEQKNYTQLEDFLLSLWKSREVQRSWSPEVVLRIGTLLVQAHFLAKHPDRAIALCNTIYYNLRRSHGGLDSKALSFADQLTKLLKAAGRRRDAERVHEDVVSDLDEHMISVRSANVCGGANGGPNGNGSGTTTDELDDRLRAVADRHLEGLRRCGWASRSDGQKGMSEVYTRLCRYGPLEVQPVEKWGPVNEHEFAKHREAPFSGTIEWVLIGSDADKEARSKKKRDSVAPAMERWGCWQAPPKQVQLVR